MVQEGNQNRNVSPQAHRYRIDERHFKNNYLHSSAFTFNIGLGKTNFQSEIYKQVLDVVMQSIIHKQKDSFQNFVNKVTSSNGITTNNEAAFMAALNGMMVKDNGVQEAIDSSLQQFQDIFSFKNTDIKKDMDKTLDQYIEDAVNEALSESGVITKTQFQNIVNTVNVSENKISIDKKSDKDTFIQNDNIRLLRNYVIDAIAERYGINKGRFRALFYGASNSEDLMGILIGIGLKTKNGKDISHANKNELERLSSSKNLKKLIMNINSQNIMSQQGTKSSINGAISEFVAESMLKTVTATSDVLKGITISNTGGVKIDGKTVKRDIQMTFTDPAGEITQMGISVKSLKFIELSSGKIFFQHGIDSGSSLDYLIDKMGTVPQIGPEVLEKFRYIVTNYASLRVSGSKTGYGTSARATGKVPASALEGVKQFTTYVLSAYLGLFLGTTFEENDDGNLMNNGMFFHPYSNTIVPIYRVLENAKIELTKGAITNISFQGGTGFSPSKLYKEKYKIFKYYSGKDFIYPNDLINLGSSAGFGQSSKIKYRMSIKGLQDLLKY